MAFHWQNSRAIFKIYLPVEQNLECFLFRTIVNPLFFFFMEHTSKRAYNWWELLNRIQRTFKTNLVAINAKFSGKVKELALFGFF